MMQETKQNTVQPLLLTISEAAKILSLGRTKVYELIDKEGLPVLRFGRAVRVSPAALQQWLEGRSKQSIA